MDREFSRITWDPGVCGGQACIRGMRITVAVILKHLAAQQTQMQILDEFPELQIEDINECLRFAAWLASGRSAKFPSAA